MAKTPLAEHPSSLKLLGIAFIGLVIFFIWLTFAFFNKSFVDYDYVTLTGDKAGLNLPENADVKLRGVIVGEVRGIESTPDGAKLKLGMNPDLIDNVPANVTAEIIPKTLFGEKYVSLIPDADNTSEESLKAGDTISRAKVPIEVETLLNDLYPLLEALDPAKLSYTLSAVSQALDGRGEKLGDTLVSLNDYLVKLNPDTPQLVDDLVQLGEVSNGYANAMPQIGRTLENTVTTGNTIVAKRAQFAAFFDEGTALANTLTEFTKTNGKNLEALAKQSRSILDVQSRYSSTFPCFFHGLKVLTPRASSVLRNRTVHIDLETLPNQPEAYTNPEYPNDKIDPGNETNPDEAENAVLPTQKEINDTDAADPNLHRRTEAGGPAGLGAACDDLKQYNLGAKNEPYSQADPFPTFPAEVYQLIGIETDHHGKFGSPSDFDRAPAASGSSFVDASLDAVDSAAQRAMLARLAGAIAGVPADEMPDVASLMLSPVIRGSEVTIR